MAIRGQPLECAIGMPVMAPLPWRPPRPAWGQRHKRTTLGLTYLFALLTTEPCRRWQRPPLNFLFLSYHPPVHLFWLPKISINHKCPYDNSAPCHLITKVQPTSKTCHSFPFIQNSKQHISDYSGAAYGHFQTPPLQSASTTNLASQSDIETGHNAVKLRARHIRNFSTRHPCIWRTRHYDQGISM